MSGGGYKSVCWILDRYWKSYGGWTALVRSPYLHAALVMNLLMYQSWMNPEWWEQAISVLASLVGFTLGGYAILIAFGDEEFKSLLTGASEKAEFSPFVMISATFVHFILVQILAILVALIARSHPLDPIVAHLVRSWPCLSWIGHAGTTLMYTGWFVGHGLFVYALFLGISATLGIFRVSIWYDKAKTRARDGKEGSHDDKGGAK